MASSNKEYRRKQGRSWRENHREQARAMQKAYRELHKEEIKQRHLERMKDKQERLKYNVRHTFGRAIRNGYIEKPEGMTFHHVDYSRPYYGAWVSYADHKRIHHGLLACPPCVDYSEQVAAGIKAALSQAAYKTLAIRWGYVNE